jgi:hypothetical protein
MKKLIFSLMVLLSAVPAFAQNSQYRACTCLEFERRDRGLSYVANYVNLSYQERNDIYNQLQRGRSNYNQVNFYSDSQDRQNQLCSLGNQAVDYSWRRWQPWLAQNGIDYVPNCW